jgi:hypothetical protein
VGEYFSEPRFPVSDAPPFHPIGAFRLSDCQFERCTFYQGRLPEAASPDDLHRVSRSSFESCTAVQCHISTLVLDDVLIRDLKIERGGRGNMLIVWAALFQRVTLAGHVGSLKINLEPRPLAKMPRWFEFYKRFYSSVDWAIDIRDTDFKLGMEFHWVPGSLVRRDPETQVLVTREKLKKCDLRALPVRDITRVEFEWFLERSPFDDVIIAAFPSERGRNDKLHDIATLRELGLAEPD